MKQRFPGKADRVNPYVSVSEMYQLEDTRVDVGDGYDIKKLPSNLRLSGPWGTYDLSIKIEGREIVIHRSIYIQPFKLSPADYLKFIDLCTQIDRKEEETVTLIARQ